MVLSLAIALAGPLDLGASRHVADTAPLLDPMRPVSEIRRDGFSLQYTTTQRGETRVEVREGDLPSAAFGAKPDGPVRVIRLQAERGGRQPQPTTFHTIRVRGLKPGRRYFYRVFDPSAKPSPKEARWGAEAPWRREFAVSTLAPKGRKTIVRLPVKVLLMPNVINIQSAYAKERAPAPLPARATPEEIQKIKDEFAVSSRFFWVNSGMRLWVDYHFFIDDRWQRWGPEPAADADPFYKGWPASRSYPGRDYADPGGGDFTIVDTKDPLRVTKEPVVEERPYSAQVEMAWPRRWNPTSAKWEFYASGGGTYGVDEFPRGFPGRSQFLAGGDTAWLATHEVHHNLESHGAFSLADREDERIVFNHYAPRRRIVRPDGSAEENAWSTAGRHGEHWDGMAFWDRTLSDAQWLRMYLGYTETVADSDEDGFPDRDARLPLDEDRFGSSPRKMQTDGRLNDLAKAMLSTWVPGPLQPTWIKPPFQAILPKADAADSDEDGLDDAFDPYPLYPWPPFIAPMRPVIDGDPAEWENLYPSGVAEKGGISFVFKHAHDRGGYSGLVRISGPWRRLSAVFDGEGQGIYSGTGVQGFDVHHLAAAAAAAGPVNSPAEVRPGFGALPKELEWKARRMQDGSVSFEFRLPNRREGPWFWTGAGREIGVVFTIFDDAGRAYSVYEPYRPFYARMIEAHGQAPMPPDHPQEIRPGPGVEVIKPGDPRLKTGEWTLSEGRLMYSGDVESPLHLEGLRLGDFDFLAVIEAKQDAVLGAFTSGNREMSASRDYVGFVGGYGNLVSKLRLFGQEDGESDRVMSPGLHRVQLSRRKGEVWLLLDGQPIVHAPDPNPRAVIDRLAVIGGYRGAQVVHELRLRR